MKYSKYNKGPRQRKFRNQKDMLKYFLKMISNQRPAKEIKSLIEEERIIYPDSDWESLYKYGFIKGSETWTDDEIKEWIEDEWCRIYSPYDCTGKLFTVNIYWHRNPNGVVSYKHWMSVDV